MNAAQFLVLSCPNCGAKLEVQRELARFACTYCGTEVLSGSSAGPRGGAERVAAELALVRLEKEWRAANRELETLSAEYNQTVGYRALAGGAALLPGVLAFFIAEPVGWKLFGLVLAAIGGLTLRAACMLRPPENLPEARERVRDIRLRIAQHRAVVDSTSYPAAGAS